MHWDLSRNYLFITSNFTLSLGKLTSFNWFQAMIYSFERKYYSVTALTNAFAVFKLREFVKKMISYWCDHCVLLSWQEDSHIMDTANNYVFACTKRMIGTCDMRTELSICCSNSYLTRKLAKWKHIKLFWWPSHLLSFSVWANRSLNYDWNDEWDGVDEQSAELQKIKQWLLLPQS